MKSELSLVDRASRKTVGPAVAPEDLEAYQVLLARAEKRFGRIPAPWLVRHVLALVDGGDWPVRREALEALLRRYESGKKDRLGLVSKPSRASLLGLYRTAKRRQEARPYRTVLLGLDPLRGSCDCPDFLRGSLGLCKHLLVVVETIASRPRLLQAALKEQAELPPLAAAPRWNPIRPLTGAGDWLERVAMDGSCIARTGHVEEPERRLEIVRGLLDRIETQHRRHPELKRFPDPALEALLAAETGRLERAIARTWDRRELTAALKSLKQKLYPYQWKGVSRFLAARSLLLADDMGLGKTAQAIACCHVLWTTGKARRGLIIVPAALKPQWHREWQLFTDAPAEVVDGDRETRAATFRATKAGFLIMNYEQLIRDLETVQGWKADLIVLDEAQRMKNWATKTAAFIKQLDPPYRLVLTGTPMENRIDELASIMDWVDDFALEPKWRLVPWHTTAVDGKREIGGARNLDTLRQRLAPSMLRRVRQEVLSQLPSRTDTRVPVEMTPEQLEEHAALDLPIRTLMSIAKKRPLTQPELLRLMQLLTAQRIISNGLAQLRFPEVWPQVSKVSSPTDAFIKTLSTPKLLELRELLGQIAVSQGRKVVVFSQWLRMLRLADWAVTEVLAGSRLRAVYFTGEESTKRRTQNIVDFHDDPATAVLFASDAGGVGLNLQRAASCVVNLDMPWNPAVLEQRIGRIYRLGQKRPIDIYNLVSEQGIEARIFQLLATKKALFSGLFDGTSDTVTFEGSGSFLSRLEKIVAAPPKSTPVAEEDGGDAESPAARQLDETLAALDERGSAAPEPAPPLALPTTAAPIAAPAPADTSSAPAPSAAAVQALFSRLEIHPTAAGGLHIEAPPEAAAALAALLDGFARLLQGPARN